MLASSTIIEALDAMRKAGLASLAFFYCDFREDKKKDLRGLLSSLLVQLCHQSDSYYDIILKFYSEHAKGLRHPSDDALVGCLKNLFKQPGMSPALRSSGWHDGAWVRWGANRSPDADRWFAMTRYSRFVT